MGVTADVLTSERTSEWCSLECNSSDRVLSGAKAVPGLHWEETSRARSGQSKPLLAPSSAPCYAVQADGRGGYPCNGQPSLGSPESSVLVPALSLTHASSLRGSPL